MHELTSFIDKESQKWSVYEAMQSTECCDQIKEN